MSCSQQSQQSQSSYKPLLGHEVDFSKISYSEVNTGKSNASFKSSYISYDGGKFEVQTPWLRTWDGICEPPEEFRQQGAPPKYSLNFSLKGKNLTQVETFQQFLSQFDEKIIEDACRPEYTSKWLKKKSLTPEVCEHLYNRQLKFAKDKLTGDNSSEYPASFKVKVPYYEGVWKCLMYNDKQEQMEGELNQHLTGKCDVRAILKCNAVWFAGGKFGVSWQIQQVEYRSDENGAKGYNFRSTDEDELTPVPVNTETSEILSEDEEEVEDSDVE